VSIYFDFQQIGKLTIEKIFFSGQHPILFTCRSDSSTLFLCVCCWADKGIQKWLLSEGQYSLTNNDLSDWHPDESYLLPTTGEYIDAEEGEFSEEIKFYRLIQANEEMKQVEEIT